MRFTPEKTTDAKRLVRGEHWKWARHFLRKRDRVHNKKWRIATLAGGNPKEEIECIRELMPLATIIAIDIDPDACAEALYSGADNAVNVDLFAWQYPTVSVNLADRRGKVRPVKTSAPQAMADLFPLDVLNLDLCGTVTREMEMGASVYSTLVRDGCLMLTFSYGRDVVEYYDFDQEYRGLPTVIAPRVKAIDQYIHSDMDLVSALSYKGAAMPMCSLLWTDRRVGYGQWMGRNDVPHEKVGDDDLLVAVEYPDVAKLYGLPPERIAAFKRKLAAIKAVATRRAKPSDAQQELQDSFEQ